MVKFRKLSGEDIAKKYDMGKRTVKECVVKGCKLPRRAWGYCNKHYQRVKRHGTPVLDPTNEFPYGTPCSERGCTNKIRARGMCNKHYTAAVRHRQ